MKKVFLDVLEKSKTTPDVPKLAQISKGLIKKKERMHIINPHVAELGLTLTKSVPRYPPLPYQQEDTGDVLGHCWLQLMTQQYKSKPDDVDAVTKAFGNWLLREVHAKYNDPGRTLTLYQVLNKRLKVVSIARPGSQLPLPIASAWAVLRSQTGQLGPCGHKFTYPPEEDIKKYINDSVRSGKATAEPYSEAIQGLLSSATHTTPLPQSIDDLDSLLARFVGKKDFAALVTLWTRFRELVQHSAEHKDNSSETTPELLRDDLRDQILTRFLRVFLRTVRTYREETRRDLIEEVMTMAPRPLPRSIQCLLLAHRAQVDDLTAHIVQEGSSLNSLGPALNDEKPKDNSRTSALERLGTIWKETLDNGGVRDIAMYMIYIRGLGRYGDLDKVQQTWNEFINDEQCKAIYHSENGDEAPWPPTAMLNHVISASFLIPKIGPMVGLNLFDQAAKHDSAIKCDIITINTVLRHHARMADIDSMTHLFDLASELSLKPDIVTYTTLMQGLLRAGRVDLASAALTAMHNQGVEPNERMCSLLIADLSKNGDSKGLEKAEQLLSAMKQNNLRVGVETWTALVSGYFNGGWEADGWDAVSRMETSGRRFNQVGYNMILRQAGLMDVQKNTWPLGGWRRGQESLQYKVFKKMVDDGVTPNNDTYVITLMSMLKMRRWAEADYVEEVMDRQKFSAEKGNLRGLLKMVRLRRFKGIMMERIPDSDYS
ncbi:hypothetical protein TREMEDRAFT_28279 [Tremella mesenterica DSM 1558]|uniref:uncharacterized protein n=1 Tax=Tremella mesenterica (strain ATCC 24925 / CBS 8224 / DSM 1558 / NBRC 9311 / NRRL Y-6157 / RJB 2259-6 / UBC 559-6) TaxID=578456 RepID=UPI0003F49871|nr:uncharacterized protein TREMEDRAFT_28279 [Tremella mesenterica DSM 1558]EIW71165.1 hypothetical protein TREMEDRAFT_28279 [Tremella mesenterica DSM 1558]